MCCQKTFDRTRALFYQVQIHYHNCYLCEEKFVAQIVSVSMMSLDKITIKSSVETVLRGILEGHCHVGVFIIAYLGRSAFNSHFKQISIPGWDKALENIKLEEMVRGLGKQHFDFGKLYRGG